MAHRWFESVEIARARAEKVLPRSVYGALRAGSEAGLTLEDNVAAFRELRWSPTVADKPATRDLAADVMGQRMALPVLISPTGVQMVHPDAELALARAAAARGTALGLSNFGSTPMEAVVAANPLTFFQIYWCGSRAEMTSRIDRAKRAGIAGMIVTLDWSFSHGRDWGSPAIPEAIDLRTALAHAPELASRPRYAMRYLRQACRCRALPRLDVPNMVGEAERAPGFFEAYGQWMATPPPSWADLAWLREQWDGPFMLKGIMRADDARRAVDAGFSTLSVSNHGGNNLDGTPAALRALPPIVEAVGSQVEVIMDGGVRRGSDVVKAVALGARAVMIGRASLWALAVGGQAGVENLLDVLRGGIDSAMLGLGKASLSDISSIDLAVPPDFTAGVLGAATRGPSNASPFTIGDHPG